MATSTATPTREELLALYDVAQRLRDARPWTAMCDSDLFGVRDPETGAVGYCSVMGQLGEYFAVHVYLGGAGIASYLAVQDAADERGGEPDDLRLILAGRSQLCLVLEFQNATELGRAEKALLKDLGLSFRGRHAWPSFRREDPGLEPAHLDRGEARFLTAALEQTLVVAARFAEDESVVRGPLSSEQVLVRVPTRAGGSTTWNDVVESVEAAPPVVSDRLPEVVGRALERLPLRPTYLELAHSFLPGMVKERRDQRGLLLRMLLLVDPGKGLILGHHVFEPGEFPRGAAARVAAMLLMAGSRPKHLVLSDPLLHDMLAAVPQLRPTLKLVGSLKAAAAAYASLCEMMGA
jgi:hypothetical protein